MQNNQILYQDKKLMIFKKIDISFIKYFIQHIKFTRKFIQC